MKTTFTFLKATLALVLFCVSTYLPAESNSNVVFGLHCPDDVWIDCTDELWDLSIYGNAYYVDYSGTYDAGEPEVEYNLNSCNSGTIIRTWSQYIYGYLFSCSQTIYVSGGGLFDESDISWPPFEYTVQGCNPPTDPEDLPYPYSGPDLNFVPCSMVGTAHSDQVFYFSSTCKKILRKWTVIDWCQYNSSYPYLPGKWEYTQVIKIEMAEEPVIYCPDDLVVWANTCSTGVAQLPPLVVEGNACGGDYIITNDSPYAEEGGADASGIYPIGNHEVRFKIEYACGKKKFCYVNIEVVDSKAAVPICYGNIAVALMPVFEDNNYDVPVDGMVEIWAKDLDKGSYHPCRPNEELIFSFSSDTEHQSEVFSCSEVGENEVEMWVTDERGNQSFCIVTIDVQNNGANIPDCEPFTSGRIAGQLADMWDTPVEEAMVKLTGIDIDTSYQTYVDTSIIVQLDSFQNASGAWLFYEIRDTVITEVTDTILNDMVKEMYSSEWGDYMFEELGPFHHYLISPEKSSKMVAGIETSDIVKAFHHLIGRESFDHPFYYLAADVDQSGSFDLMDLILMLDIYQGRIQEFPVESNWIFVPKDQELPSPENAFDIEWQHSIEIQSLNNHSMYNNFWAIQLGNLMPPLSDDDGGRTQRFSKTVHTEELNNFTLQKDYHLFIASLHETSADIPDELQSQVLSFTKNNKGYLLWVADKDINQKLVEQMDLNGEIEQLSVFRSRNIEDLQLLDPSISQIRSFPNPFKDEVRIRLHSQITQEAQLEIRNSIGELILRTTKSLHQGENAWQIDLNHFQNNGLLHYTIRTDDYEFHGKWIQLQ